MRPRSTSKRWLPCEPLTLPAPSIFPTYFERMGIPAMPAQLTFLLEVHQRLRLPLAKSISLYRTMLDSFAVIPGHRARMALLQRVTKVAANVFIHNY